ANAPVIEEPAPVEDHALNALLDRPLGNRPADLLRTLQVAAGHSVAERRLDLRFDARRGDERLAAQVIDQLGVDVRNAAEHAQPRALAGARNPLALPQLDAPASIVLRLNLHNRSRQLVKRRVGELAIRITNHQLPNSPIYLAPVFPAFFFSTSPV